MLDLLPDFQSLSAAAVVSLVFLIIAVETMGVPAPGATILIGASLYAGATGGLNIVAIAAAGSLGAFTGTLLGFLLGRSYGYPLLLRYGRYIRVTESRLKIGQYLFFHYGSLVVLLGRFASGMRCLSGVLAGVNQMHWLSFLWSNAAGAIAWSTIYSFTCFFLGHALMQTSGWLRIAATVTAMLFLGTIVYLLVRNEHRLAAAAEDMFPGPLQTRE